MCPPGRVRLWRNLYSACCGGPPALYTVLPFVPLFHKSPFFFAILTPRQPFPCRFLLYWGPDVDLSRRSVWPFATLGATELITRLTPSN